MIVTKDELVSLLADKARECFEYLPKWLAEEMADGILDLEAEKEAEHQRKLNIVHMFYCAVFHPGENGEQRECDCGSTTTITDGMVELDGS